MPSPFPGMDPYLEGHLWPDVHSSFAHEIRRRLVPLIRPRYVARLEVTVVEDESPEAEIGIMYPDVEVFAARRASVVGEGPELRLTSVEVRSAIGNELVTTIEILSPVKKKDPGLTKYRRKRDRLIEAGVHLLEVDLLRRGTRALAGHPRLPHCSYLVTLTRRRAPGIEVWPLRLQDLLPEVPVPLREPDPDVGLKLTECLRAVYDEALYDLSVDYVAPPPPPELAQEEGAWAREQITCWRQERAGS